MRSVILGDGLLGSELEKQTQWDCISRQRDSFDITKPDGTSRKFLDSKKINNFGFKPSISLKEGLTKTYQDYTKLNANF